MVGAIMVALLELASSGHCMGPEHYPADEIDQITGYVVIDECAIPMVAGMEIGQ